MQAEAHLNLHRNEQTGGLTMIWRKDLLINKVLFTDFTIEVQVEGKRNEDKWWFVGIYASSKDQVREQQWRIIENRNYLWGSNWILAGDMNDILSHDEKWGGIRRGEFSFRVFRDFVNRNRLIDIGFEGIPWTWCNNWEGDGEIKERLDRVLCTTEWRKGHGKAKCVHIQNEASDHCMILLDTEPKSRKWKRRFYFDRSWLQHKEVGNIIKTA